MSALFEIDPRDFGAKGDGKHDDTKAWYAALDDAGKRMPPGGGHFYVAPGTYRINGGAPLTIPTQPKT